MDILKLHRMIEKGDFSQVTQYFDQLSYDIEMLLQNEIHQKKGQYQDILQNLNSMDPSPSSSDYIRSGYLYQRAVVSFRLGDFELAGEEVSDMLNEFDSVSADAAVGYWIISAHNLAAALLTTEGSYQKARPHLDAAIELVHQIGYKEKLGHLYNNYGSLEFSLGNYHEAEKWDNRGITVFREQGYTRYIAVSMSNIAENLIIQGRLREAESMLLDARQLLHDEEEFDALTDVLKNLGQIYHYYDEFDKASQFLREANDIAQKNQNPFYLSNTYYHLIIVLLDMDKYNEAGTYIDKFRRLTKVTEVQTVTSKFHLVNGIQHFYQERYTKAIEEFEHWISKEINHGVKLKFLYYLALVYLEQVKQNRDVTHSMEQLQHLTTQIGHIGQSINSPILRTQSLVLQSQIHLINEKIDAMFATLDKAKSIATTHALSKLNNQVENIEDDIRQNALSQSRDTRMSERMRNSLLSYYIRQIMRININTST